MALKTLPNFVIQKQEEFWRASLRAAPSPSTTDFTHGTD